MTQQAAKCSAHCFHGERDTSVCCHCGTRFALPPRNGKCGPFEPHISDLERYGRLSDAREAARNRGHQP